MDNYLFSFPYLLGLVKQDLELLLIRIETVLFFVYTSRQRNFAFHITHEHKFLFSHAQLIGFTTTCDWL